MCIRVPELTGFIIPTLAVSEQVILLKNENFLLKLLRNVILIKFYTHAKGIGNAFNCRSAAVLSI